MVNTAGLAAPAYSRDRRQVNLRVGTSQIFPHLTQPTGLIALGLKPALLRRNKHWRKARNYEE